MAEPAGVDVHAHFFPESFIRILEEAGGAFGASVDRANPKGPVLVVGGTRTAPLDDACERRGSGQHLRGVEGRRADLGGIELALGAIATGGAPTCCRHSRCR